MQVRGPDAELEIADGEDGVAGGGATQEFQVQGYGVGLGAGGVVDAHVLARDEEEERGDVAAVGDGADAPCVFEGGGVAVAAQGGDGRDV